MYLRLNYNKMLTKRRRATIYPSGKTIVGLILVKWKRQKFKEKVIYVCPTNQLVHQIEEQAENQYGLKVAKFVGRIIDCPISIKSDYESADKI